MDTLPQPERRRVRTADVRCGVSDTAVLLITANDELREQLSTPLLKAGYPVESCDSILIAEEMLASGKTFHVIIADLQTETERILGFLVRAKDRLPQVRALAVVNIAGFANEHGARRSKALDQCIAACRLCADGFVFDPVEREQLLTSVEHALSHPPNRNRGLAEIDKEDEREIDFILERMSRAIDTFSVGQENRSRVVTAFSIAMGRAYGLDHAHVRLIARTAYLQDLGYAVVPSQILNKPGPLTPEETDVVRKHCAVGYELLRGTAFPGVTEEVAEMVYAHHEFYDGTGYPRGLRKEQIPFGSRIIAVAAALEAITSWRPYRAAQSVEEATRKIAYQSGRQFDPAVVDIFLQVPDAVWRDLRAEVERRE